MSGAMNTLSAPNSSSASRSASENSNENKKEICLELSPSNAKKKNQRGNARLYLGESFYFILQRLSERSRERNELEAR